jgi:hypothetical protein
MNIRLNFWRDPSRWPRDTASHVFLARAVQETGKALFLADWTGGEPCVELMQSIPVGGSGSRQHSVKKLWAEIHSTITQDRKDKGRALERFSKVREQIIQFAEAGKLITALRPIAGGDPVTVPRSWWNSERLSVRFDYCQMNPAKPFDGGIAGDGYCWIFVSRESLEICLRALTGSSRRESAAAALKPESAPQEVATPKPRGRKPGDGSYGPLDQPILEEMKELISLRQAASPEAAAKLLAGKAHGAGSLESKAERLAKRYRATASGLNSLGSDS